MVSNGTCSDSATGTVALDNEVKAIFTMPDFICPEDPLLVTNSSTGQIDQWRWNFDIISSSTLKDPSPFLFPTLNKEAYYTVKLVATNNTLGCSDSARKTLTVLDHCFIAVPTAFTPNNDGLNDYFSPHNALKADNYDFQIYNRWGQRLFNSRNWKDKWDGRVNGVLQTTGVYVWMLSYTHHDTGKQVFQKGTVTLIR
jgi:gliding motility-associated-like protein